MTGIQEMTLSTVDWSMDIVPRGDEDGRVFTLEQANRSLVLLRRIVGEVVREYGVLLELEEQIESAERADQPQQLEQARQKLVTTVDNLQTCLEELDQIGVELRDFARGIVDFPCRHDGRLISLSWMYGEEEVSHWYERHASFACRQPIELLQYHAVAEPVVAHSVL